MLVSSGATMDLWPVIRTAIVLAVVALPVAAQTSDTTERSAAAGAYTEAQAALGENVYKALCSACHVPSDQSGEQFKMNWFGRTVFDYFTTLKKTMPDDNPGGLSDDEYTRVTAYILKLNGFPAGADSLAADSTMKRIKIGPPAADATKPRTR
jgi:mono/diheme cytochrome c family protein